MLRTLEAMGLAPTTAGLLIFVFTVGFFGFRYLQARVCKIDKSNLEMRERMVKVEGDVKRSQEDHDEHARQFASINEKLGTIQTDVALIKGSLTPK